MLYELMVVSRVEGAEGMFAKVEKAIKDLGLTPVGSSKLGKKQLAYNIQKQTEAEYFLFHFEGEGEPINSLSSRLRLEQELVLRYLILKTKASKIAKEAPETKKVTVKAVAVAKVEVEGKGETKVVKVIKEKVPKVKKETKKVAKKK